MADPDTRNDPKSHDPVADGETAWHGRDRIAPPNPGGAPSRQPLDVEAAPRATRSKTGNH